MSQSLLQAYADADHALHQSFSAIRAILARLDALAAGEDPANHPVSPARPPIGHGHVVGSPLDLTEPGPNLVREPSPTLAHTVVTARRRATPGNGWRPLGTTEAGDPVWWRPA